MYGFLWEIAKRGSLSPTNRTIARGYLCTTFRIVTRVVAGTVPGCRLTGSTKGTTHERTAQCPRQPDPGHLRPSPDVDRPDCHYVVPVVVSA